MLPNFLLIGAARAGTTSLYRLLSQHPDIFLPTLKEPNYFSHAWQTMNRHQYEQLFADAGDATARGEASVTYTFGEAGAERYAARIHDVLGHPRLVYIVRDPVARAYSHYWYRRGSQPDLGSFEEELIRDPLYTETGRYVERLAPFLVWTRPEDLHLVVYEELFSTPELLVPDLLRFLGVDPNRLPAQPERANASAQPRRAHLYRFLRKTVGASRARRLLERAAGPARTARVRERALRTAGLDAVPPMAAATEAALREQYREDNCRLAAVMARADLPWPA